MKAKALVRSALLVVLTLTPVLASVAPSATAASYAKHRPVSLPVEAATPQAQAPQLVSTPNDLPSAERAALVALYNSTNGPNWKNHSGWLVAEDPCSWYGVTCVAVGNGNHVRHLSLWDNRLAGTLPPELGNLTMLSTASLNVNTLTGAIPSSLGNLTSLEYLGLDSNQLSGPLPSSIGNLTNLTYLNL